MKTTRSLKKNPHTRRTHYIQRNKENNYLSFLQKLCKLEDNEFTSLKYWEKINPTKNKWAPKFYTANIYSVLFMMSPLLHRQTDFETFSNCPQMVLSTPSLNIYNPDLQITCYLPDSLLQCLIIWKSYIWESPERWIFLVFRKRETSAVPSSPHLSAGFL